MPLIIDFNVMLRRPVTSAIAIVCLAVFFSAATAAAAQFDQSPLPDHPRYAIEHFGERFGLGAVTVTAMAQDDNGFLWLGTENGVFRYDGTDVKRFGRREGLPGELVDLILIAPDGVVWVRTRKGISRLKQERFETIALPPEAGPLRDVHQSFAVDKLGQLFVSTAAGFWVIEPGGSIRQIYERNNPNHSIATDAVVRAPDDSIWIAADGRLGQLAPGETSVKIVDTIDLGKDRIQALLAGPHRLWLRSDHHVGFIDTSNPSNSPQWHDQGLPEANLMGGPSLDRSGNLLLPTANGLYRWNDEKWKLIDHSNGLTSSAVVSALEDNEGGIWIGTAGAGLDHWPGSQQWSGWTDSEGLPDALVLGVVRDHRSRLWVGTNTALAVWDPTTRRWHAWTGDGLTGAGVRQLLLSPDGSVWAFFPSRGLYRFDASSPTPRAIRFPDSDNGWQPHRITMAPDGSVWADGVNALHLIRYAGGRFSTETRAVPQEVRNTTNYPSMSPSGVLWTGGPHGLSRLANGHWQHFQKSQGLLADDVVNVAAVSDDQAWVGYPDEGSVTQVRVSSAGNSVVNHVQRGVCALGADSHKNVWLEMDQGVVLISPAGNTREFRQTDGLIWDDVNCDGLWNEANGTVLIGTSKGLARFDPTQEARGTLQPRVTLTSAVFGRQDRIGETSPDIEYNDRSFQARFASPIFRDPDKVSCRYRMKGLDSEPTETSLREVRYSALPPGGYTFEVSCGSVALGWSGVTGYPFTVRSPWWQTKYARLLYLTLLALLIFAVIHYRTSRDRKDRKRLEVAVAERSQELAKLNLELQELSLKDPLTGLRNRRFFDTTIPADASQALRAGNSEHSRDHCELIFFLIDLDNFKHVNDSYGHDVGDRLLVAVAQRLRRIVRESDFLIRWGGEEFLVVCRSADRTEAHQMAERILSAIGSTPFDLGREIVLNKTCSVGWAPFPWSRALIDRASTGEILRLADRGLYRAKSLGKNCAIGLLPNANFRKSGGQVPETAPVQEINTPGPEIVKASTAGV